MNSLKMALIFYSHGKIQEKKLDLISFYLLIKCENTPLIMRCENLQGLSKKTQYENNT